MRFAGLGKTSKPSGKIAVECDVPASMGQIDAAERYAIRHGMSKIKMSEYIKLSRKA